MTSSSANLPSSKIASAASPLAGLMQTLAASPDSGPRAATTNFDSLLAPGAARAPRAVLATGAQAAALPAQALNNAAAASQPGLLAAMQPIAVCDELCEVEAPVGVETVEGAEPLRAALETTAAMLIPLVQSLLVEEVAPVGEAASAEVTVEIPGEPEFTVTVPRTLNPVAAEALTQNAARIAGREPRENPNAAPQSHGTRAVQTLTAIAAGLQPPAVDEAVDAQPAENTAGTIEAEIALPTGGTVRLAIKPAGATAHGAKIDLAGAEAEIAPDSSTRGEARNETADSLKKTFLSIVDKQLSGEGRGAGITAAKSGANMPDQAQPSLPSTFGTAKASELAVGLMEPTGGLLADKAETTDPVQSVARRAVDTAVNLMEIQAGLRGRNLSTVSVRMKLAGEDLAIRVRLRDGEVHTSFQTASADLRAAISREWQVAASESPQRILRFHEPEFSNVDRNLADRGASEQHSRDGNAAREQAQLRREAGIVSGLANRAPVAAPSILPAAVAEILAPGSLHLSTFA